MSNNFDVGDPVRKTKGYEFPGIVVAKFTTLSGKVRVVVECTIPGVQGCLHIFSQDDLEYFT